MKSDNNKKPEIAPEYTCPMCGETHKRSQLCPKVAEIMFNMDDEETSRIMGSALLECIHQKKDFSQMLIVLDYFIRFLSSKDNNLDVKFMNTDLIISFFAKILGCKVEQFFKKNSYLANEYAEILDNFYVDEMNCNFYDDGSISEIDLELGGMEELYMNRPIIDPSNHPTLHFIKSFDGKSYSYFLTYKPGQDDSKKIYTTLSFGHRRGSTIRVEGFELCSDRKGKLKDCFENMYSWKDVACECACPPEVFHRWIEKLSPATSKGYLDWIIKARDDSTTYSTRYGKADVEIHIIHKAQYSDTSDTILIRENENIMYSYEKERHSHGIDDIYSHKEEISKVLRVPELRQMAELIIACCQKRADDLFLKNNVERKLKRSDTIAVTYSFMCSQKNHSIMPYCGIVPILSFDNQKIEEKVYLGYCRQCDLFYMFSRDYNRLSKEGTILCKVISASTGNTVYDPTFKFTNETSILSQYGYNVQASNNLSFDERKKILDRIIDDKAMSIHSMINLLEMQIHLHRKKRNYASAVSKWEMDVDYLKGYGISSGREKHLVEKDEN